MPVIMTLDVGSKTIGVAFTDSSGFLAFPGDTIIRQAGYRRDMALIRALVSERGVTSIVVGIPLMPDGSRGEQAVIVEEFVTRLRNNVRIPIEWQDEAYTTVGAEAILDELGIPRELHKRKIDSVAAALILQDYLDRRRRESE